MKRHPTPGFTYRMRSTERAFSLTAAVLFSLTPLSVSAAGTAGSGSSSRLVPSAEYPLPNYSNTKFPAITSCNVKSGQRDGASGATTTGNVFIDSTTATATTIKDAIENKREEGSEEPDEDGIQDGVGLNQNCGEPTKLNLDEKIAEKLACSKFTEDADFITKLKEENESASRILACQRGVLAAINGELSCFKKQITDAQSYMNDLINNPGGLNSMVSTGVTQMGEIDQEIGDREAQLAELKDRLENPRTGMAAAREALDKLTSEIPVQQAAVENDIQKTREQQSRYEALIQQAIMGRTLACLQRETPGYTCVKAGSTSKKYASGDVSPIDYMACIYAQKANLVTGGKVVKNESLEDTRLKQVQSTVKGLSMATITDIPALDDKNGYSAAMKSYQITTPAQLIAAFGPLTSAADKATGKGVSTQFKADVTRCHNEAKAQTERDRTNSNTNIGVGKTLMAQMAKNQSAAYATQMRKLKSTYESAVKSATGKSIQLNTSRCEKESLENQAKCLDAIGSLVDAVLTGDANAATSKLTGPAASLTSGQPPISGFLSALKAPSDSRRQVSATSPSRTIANIDCKGLNECVAKYESLKTELVKVVEERKQRKESMKSEINNHILQAAQTIASGKNAQGVQVSTLSLNQVAKSLSDRKEQLIQAMKNMKVGGSLELDPEKVGEMEIDEKTGLYKPNSLRNVVLAAIDPKMLSNDEKGFAAASKEIQKRDDDLEEKQAKLNAYVEKAEARKGECRALAIKAECDRAESQIEVFCAQESELKKLVEQVTKIATTPTEQQGQDAKRAEVEESLRKWKDNVQLGEQGGNLGAATDIDALNCGIARKSFKSCGSATSENEEKDLNNMGDRQKKASYKSGTGT